MSSRKFQTPALRAATEAKVCAHLQTMGADVASNIAKAIGATKDGVKGAIQSLRNKNLIYKAGEARVHRPSGHGSDNTAILWRLTGQPVVTEREPASILPPVAQPAPRGRMVRVEDHGHRHGPLRRLDAWMGYGQ